MEDAGRTVPARAAEHGSAVRPDVFPLVALGVLLGATALWWAFALWPLPDEAPTWLERARSVCFDTGESGLPDRSGWILLVGQPLGMFGLLLAGWGERTSAALGAFVERPAGRTVVAVTLVGIVAGIVAAGARVSTASVPGVTLAAAETPPGYPRLDRAWPAADGLVDQHGEPFSRARLEGRPAFVTFAFAHCGSICPLVVQSVLRARDGVEGDPGSARDHAVVVLTLDPWRDTPSRLPAIAEQWGLGPRDLVLSGSVEDVGAALDGWDVPRSRDELSGDVTHPALVYLVEPDGTVAYASTGGPAQLEELARRMR